jgi:adenine-specific DNA-methyltransferase
MARKKKDVAPSSGGKRRIEQYDHRKAQRKNNPPVGLVTEATDRDTTRKQYQYDPHLDPALQWAGKAEHTSFEVPTVSLHVHERIDPKIIEAYRGTVSLPFEPGAHKRAAVKIVDDRGIESLEIVPLK